LGERTRGVRVALAVAFLGTATPFLRERVMSSCRSNFQLRMCPQPVTRTRGWRVAGGSDICSPYPYPDLPAVVTRPGYPYPCSALVPLSLMH
jgi:hypothetical protein